MTRQAPSISATECKVGTKKKGNDGKMWIVVKVKGGVHRWQKYSRLAHDCAISEKFAKFVKGKKPATLAYFKKLTPGTKVKLVSFSFGTDEVERFTFTFDRIEPVTGRNKKWYSHDIHGTSKILGDLPLFTLVTGEVRMCISSDSSDVYLA